jgi:predicted unusual protein kinase regulating ubiquinone biosynthesis (AarF/ABC1/UbiB family)
LLIDRHVFRCDADETVQKQRGAELRHLLVASRSVALIKSGQALSLRPDLVKNTYWCEELGKLVDAVGGFADVDAMQILQEQLSDLKPRIVRAEQDRASSFSNNNINSRRRPNSATQSPPSRLQKLVDSSPVLRLFEFANDGRAVASASIGQVYKARIRPGLALEAAVGIEQAARWGGRTVAIKIQRPDAEASASLDMYLLRRTAMWLSHFRGGDLPTIADAFGVQLFGELDYVREANNCDRFFELYSDWDDIVIPEACSALTRRKVLVMSWVEGEKGPWKGQDGLAMVGIGLRCSVDQLMNTGLFHAGTHLRIVTALDC